MSEPLPPWLVVFDWDGTLVNTLPRKVANAGALLSAHLGCTRAAIETAYLRHSGIPRRQLFDAISADVGARQMTDEAYARLSAEFTALNQLGVGPHVLFPDVPETLRALRAEGTALAVSSAAAPDEVCAGAAAVGLSALLDEVLGSDGPFAKGAPHLAWLSRRFGVGLDRVWMVGDEVADLRLGREAGVRTIGRLGTCTRDELAAERPVAIVTRLQEIPGLLAAYVMKAGT